MAFLPKNYVTVATRIEQFHKKYTKGSITTEFSLNGDVAVFTAKVADDEGRIFTGHSFGKLGKEKAFEKLETVAVGRALAFMGFETKEGIASREEMDIYEENEKEQKEADTNKKKEATNKPYIKQENISKLLQSYVFNTADDAISKAEEYYILTKKDKENIKSYFEK